MGDYDLHIPVRSRWIRAPMQGLAGLALLASVALAAGNEIDAEPGPRTPLQDFIDDTLPEYELYGGSQVDEQLEISARLRWDNNARGSASGLTAIYTRAGQAEAVVCVYPWAGRLVHDFGSLSRGSLFGKHEGETFWSPDRPGVEFRAVPDGPTPAPNRSGRLLQMKNLARIRFSAQLVGWDAQDTDRAELRLQPRPLYRYEGENRDVIDGAVFSYVLGVDPEVLLLLEAVRHDGDLRWEYAFVRRTSGELLGRLDDAEVWHAERYPDTSDPRGLLRGVHRPLPDDLLESEP